MVDYFSLVLSHAVLLLAFWRLMLRDDLDTEPARLAAADSSESEPAEVGKRRSPRA